MLLNDLCLYILENCRLDYPVVYNSFLILFETGIRHSELDINKIQVLPDGNYFIPAKKKSIDRVIYKSSLSDYCNYLLSNLTSDKFISSRSALSANFNFYSYPWRIANIEKNVVLHAFRHNYIKKQFKILQDYELVRLHIGHVDIINTIHYIESNLSIKPVIYIPDFEPNELDKVLNVSMYFNYI